MSRPITVFRPMLSACSIPLSAASATFFVKASIQHWLTLKSDLSRMSCLTLETTTSVSRLLGRLGVKGAAGLGGESIIRRTGALSGAGATDVACGTDADLGAKASSAHASRWRAVPK